MSAGGPTRLVVVRHTEPDESVSGRCYGRLDVGLSARGEAHALELAGLLSQLSVAAVYTSPLRRAAATAAPIAGRHGLEPQVLAGLCELDFGRLEGLTFEAAEREWPEVYREWMRAPTEVRFPDGEAYPDLELRVRRAALEIRRTHPGTTTVAVTHGGVARVLLAEALQMPRAAVPAIDQRYGAINVIDWFGGTPCVRLVNGGRIDPPLEPATA